MTRKVHPILLAGAVVVSFGVQAMAQTTAADVDRLTQDVNAKLAVLQARVDASPPPPKRKPTEQEELARLTGRAPPEPKLSPAQAKIVRLQEAVDSIRSALKEGRYTSTAQTADYHSKQTDESRRDAGTPEEWAALAKSLAALSDARLNLVIQESRELVNTVPDRMTKAKSPEDLNALDDELDACMKKFSFFLGAVRPDRQFRLVKQVREAVSRYTQVLQAEALGEQDRALKLAEDIVSESSRNAVFPGRDAVVAKANQLRGNFSGEFSKLIQDNVRTVAEAKSSDDLAGVLKLMRDGQAANTNNTRSLMAYQVERGELEKYGKILDAEKAGQTVTALELLERALQPRAESDPKSLLVPRKLLEAKRTAMQQALIGRPGGTMSPILKTLCDDFDTAETVDDLVKCAENADRILRISFGGGQATEDREPVYRLMEMRERVQLLAFLDAALQTKSWGRVWEKNRQLLQRQREYNEKTQGIPWQRKLEQLRQNALMQALVESKEMEPLKLDAKPSETLDRMLARGANEAAAEKDYSRALMILRTTALVIYGVNDLPDLPSPTPQPTNSGPRMRPVRPASRDLQVPVTLRDDLNGLAAFIQGTNAEAAGDLEVAVTSYRQALAAVGPRVPTKAATERLAAIAAQRPELLKSPDNPQQPARTPTTRNANRKPLPE